MATVFFMGSSSLLGDPPHPLDDGPLRTTVQKGFAVVQ
jgi:hypothetical protein